MNDPTDSGDISPVKTPATLQPDWVKPEFGDFIVTLNVNMDRLYRWHKRINGTDRLLISLAYLLQR
jgi:hypothetical protein